MGETLASLLLAGPAVAVSWLSSFKTYLFQYNHLAFCMVMWTHPSIPPMPMTLGIERGTTEKDADTRVVFRETGTPKNLLRYVPISPRPHLSTTECLKIWRMQSMPARPGTDN